ncbi:STAS-like domain-containing protein [Candidatus Halobeggiatoa sp. HSG11]|nr:STAS-like domain-containing protein [Candidatus Halobeggiatoa sp. HSG11]
MSTELIKITEIIGSYNCINPEDGKKVFQVIAKALHAKQQIIISLGNIEDVTSRFLNSAIGQLYGEFSEEQIKASLTVADDANQDDLALLKRVVERAKEYFNDPEPFEKADKEILGDDE